MARVLILGDPARAAGVAAAGHVVEEGEGVDPDRLVTLAPRLEGVSVLCWLYGRSPQAALHGERLAALLEHLVDTPVRGIVYERSAEHPGGEAIVAHAQQTFRMPCAVIEPGEDLPPAVAQVLAG